MTLYKATLDLPGNTKTEIETLKLIINDEKRHEKMLKELIGRLNEAAV